MDQVLKSLAWPLVPRRAVAQGMERTAGSFKSVDSEETAAGGSSGSSSHYCQRLFSYCGLLDDLDMVYKGYRGVPTLPSTFPFSMRYFRLLTSFSFLASFCSC